jgi:flavin reductase (DIM6/NTAB) family NADH-FMN oxidoreductase RutF
MPGAFSTRPIISSPTTPRMKFSKAASGRAQCMFDSALEIAEGKAGVPMVSGAIAQFVCRKVKQYDGGDHVVFLGEVEEYKYNNGEPLVFHSGRYRIAARHPDIAE